MARRGGAFLGRLTFRPIVPAVAGMALLILSLLAQSYASYIGWLARTGRGNRLVELAVDLSGVGPRQTTFRPAVSAVYDAQFTLLAPLRDDLAEYSGKDVFLPPTVTQKSLAGKEFALTWQILSQTHVVAEGRIRSLDLIAWARKDHAYYQYAFNPPALEAGREYTLAAQVEQANPAVNELHPVLQAHLEGFLKGHPLAVVWRLWHTLVFCGVGIALLLVAYIRHVHDRKLARL